MTDGVDAGASLQRAWREERAAVLATVARRLGDLQKAEDAVQEAFVAAAVRWPAQGVPDRPGQRLEAATATGHAGSEAPPLHVDGVCLTGSAQAGHRE